MDNILFTLYRIWISLYYRMCRTVVYIPTRVSFITEVFNGEKKGMKHDLYEHLQCVFVRNEKV